MDLSTPIRIVDANLNRLAEGLRTLEEIARMVLDDTALTAILKKLRHDLIRAELPFHLELLQSRNSAGDVGSALEVSGESKDKDLPLIVIANSRRAQESLRVLEEMAKLPVLAFKLDSNSFKKARFELYTLEQTLISRLVRREKASLISGLYVIIDTQALQGKDAITAAQQVIQAGVKVIQLRDKSLPKKQLIPLAWELQAHCKRNEVLFIINDYLDVALAVEADGLHIGQEDLPVAVARKLLPLDKILGCSVVSAEQAQEAESAGADYVAVGAIYPTASKSNIDVVGLDRLRQVKRAAKTPLVAIGGINRENAREVMNAGADSVCIISAILNAPDISRAAIEIMNVIKGTNEKIDTKSG
jgi:thiamine-phosphate pyrophosphorylase